MAEIIEERDVVFADAGNRPLHIDIYKPTSPNGAAVLIVHGGGWKQGSRAMLVEHARHLARDGYVAMACEYRLTPEAHWPAQIHDVKAAIRWAKVHAGELGFDPDKLCLEGHSAGAHLVLLAAGTPTETRFDPPGADTSISAAVAAVAAVYPPVLMYRGPDRPSGGTPASALAGSDVSDEVAALASPLTHIHADFPPVMLLHGDEDKVVPVSASRRFDEALRAKGGRVDLHIFGGLPHGFGNHPEVRPAMMGMISAFFRRRVAEPDAYKFAAPAQPAAAAPATQPA
jgi:acetyl esterase/lipase